MNKDTACWLIYCRERNQWWMPQRRRYCSHIEEAGRYTYAEAKAICDDANMVNHDDGGPNEFMMLSPEFIETYVHAA